MLYNRIPRCTSFYTLGASTAINLVLPAKQATHSLTGIVGALGNTALQLKWALSNKAVRLVMWFHNTFLRFPFSVLGNLSYAVLPNISLGLGDPHALPGLSKRICVIANLRLSLERCPVSSSSGVSGSLIPAHLLQIPLQGLWRDKFEKWWDFCPPPVLCSCQGGG